MPTQTIAYGYKKPQVKDKTWWYDWLFNWDRSASHSHNGVDSAKIDAANLLKPTDNILAANWVEAVVGTGHYKQTLTCPAGVTFPQTVPAFYVVGGTKDGQLIHPSLKKITSTTYEIFVINNTLTLKVVYA